MPSSVLLSSFTSVARARGRAPILKAYIPTGESVAPDGCLWTLMSQDPSTTPATTRLCRISPHSHTTRKLPRARIAYDTPERISRTRTSFHIVLDPHLRLADQKRHKLAPSGSPDTLSTPMWKTPYQRMAIRMSLNFRQPTANEEDRPHHLRRGLRSILTTNHRHQQARQHSSNRHSRYPARFFSFVLCV